MVILVQMFRVQLSVVRHALVCEFHYQLLHSLSDRVTRRLVTLAVFEVVFVVWVAEKICSKASLLRTVSQGVSSWRWRVISTHNLGSSKASAYSLSDRILGQDPSLRVTALCIDRNRAVWRARRAVPPQPAFLVGGTNHNGVGIRGQMAMWNHLFHVILFVSRSKDASEKPHQRRHDNDHPSLGQGIQCLQKLLP